MNDVIDKRNFFLALSVLNGQRIAHSAGFSTPSEDVQQSEVLDTIHKWVILSGSGIMKQVQKCIDWTLEVTTEENDLSEDEREHTREVLVAYSAATISHLLDKGMLTLSPDLEMVEGNTAEFISELFSSVVEDLDE
jgi:hypothetical protein